MITILSPEINATLPARTFTIKGVAASNSVVYIMISSHDYDEVRYTVDVPGSGSWEIDVEIATVGNIILNWSYNPGSFTGFRKFVRPLPLPYVDDTPGLNKISGHCLKEGEYSAGVLGLEVIESESGVSLGEVLVRSNGDWTTVDDLPVKIYRVKVRHRLEALLNATLYSSWSEVYECVIRPNPPVIIVPDTNDVTDVRGAISGVNGTVDAVVEVLKDFELTFKIGQGTVKSGGLWVIETYDRNMTPGVFAIVARQTYAGASSGLSTARAFNVRPPRVTQLSAVATDNGTVTISGTGYIGAEIEIWYRTGNVVKTFTVTDTPWTKSYPAWLPGSYSIDARQKVLGLNNVWIESEWSDLPTTFTVKVPLPTLSHSVGSDQKPVFFGNGNAWADQPPARVELEITGSSIPLPSLPIVNVVSNGWTNPATAQWGPGTYSVKARQLFKPNEASDLQSDWTTAESVVIKAPLPSIDTITDNGMSPDFTGTCWKGAEVTLTFSDDTTPCSVPDIDKDGLWGFRRATAFSPGSYTVKATQTFGGQTSNEVLKTFTVDLPKPVIKPMTPPVGHEPSIEGSGGYVGAVMTIYDYVTELPLGEAAVTEEAWSVQLQPLEFRVYHIYAVQSVNGTPSEKSERISFEVVLLPPLVHTPKQQDKVARSFRIEGLASRKAGIEVAEVEVLLDGAPWMKIRANCRGEFWGNATLPLGSHSLSFKQHINGVDSDYGEEVLVGVVPAKPVLETPASGDAIGSIVAISGFGYQGDTVSVAFADAIDVVLGNTQVGENGTWSLWLSLDRPAGDLSLVVQQSVEDYHSGWTQARPVELRSQPPQFTAPLPGRWVEPKPTFAGTASPGASIELHDWFDQDSTLVTHTAGDVGWEATPQNDLSSSVHWVGAVQSTDNPGGGKQESAAADSPRFNVIAVNDRGAEPAS